MPNKPYDNFFLANEIEDQYNSHLDLVQFCTVDNSLTGTAGMDYKVHVYKATDGTEKLTKGEGNTKTIEADFTEKVYKILLAQNRFSYFDEDAMTDPMVVTTGTRHAGVDLFNTQNTDIYAACAGVRFLTHLHDSTLVECCTSECERRKCRQLRTVRWRTDHCFLYDSGRLQCFAHPHHRDRSEQRGKQQRRCNCREPRNICGQNCLRRHLRCLPHQNVCRHPEHGADGSGCDDGRRLRHLFRRWSGRFLRRISDPEQHRHQHDGR